MADDLSIGKLFVELLVNDSKYGPALRKAADDLDELRVKAKKAGDDAARGVAPLATAFENVTEAEKRHIATIIASEAAEKQRAAALGITTSQLRQVESALKAESAATTAATTAATGQTAASKGQVDALGKVAVSAGSAQAAAGNLRFQLFDVVQQISAGQNPLMVLNQQGFQIAQAFGSGPSGASGALATFTAALGPIGPLFTAATAAAGPLIVVLAALVTGYAVWSNASMDVEESTTGAADAAVAAAKKIGGTAADIEKANEAWKKFRDTTEDMSIELAVADGTLTKTEAKTIERTKRVRAEADAGIRSAADQLASTQTQLQAMQALYDSDAASDARTEAAKAIPVLEELAKTQKQALDERKKTLDDTIGLVLDLGKAEKDAEDDKDGKKDKAKATRAQADALRDYDAAMRDIKKTVDDVAGADALQSAADRGGTNPIERAFQKSMEESRQKATKATEDVEKSLADALSAAGRVGGTLGQTMSDAARAAFAESQGAILGQFVSAQDEAARVADKAAKDAAIKRVEQNKATISIQVDDEQEYAATLTDIREAYVERYGELARTEIDYARLSADERLAVEQKIQAEMDDLRTQAADAELARSKKIAKDYATVGKDVFSQTKATITDLYAYQTQQIEETTKLFEADTNARQKLAAGEALSQEERSSLLTASEKQQLEKRQEAQKTAALATFRAQQALAVASIVMNTAASVEQALGTIPPPASFVAAAVMAGLGVVQAGIVLGQKPPEFHIGGLVTPEDRRMSPGRSTSRAVTTELEVGEGVLVSRAVQALGGQDGLARLNIDPVSTINRIASRIDPASGATRASASRIDARLVRASSPPPFGADGRSSASGGSSNADRPIVVVSKIGERTFDTIMADGLGGRNLPRVRQRLQRMTGVTAGLEG